MVALAPELFRRLLLSRRSLPLFSYRVAAAGVFLPRFPRPLGVRPSYSPDKESELNLQRKHNITSWTAKTNVNGPFHMHTMMFFILENLQQNVTWKLELA